MLLAQMKGVGTLRVPVGLRPVLFIALLLVIWQVAIMRHSDQLLPGPWAVALGIVDLVRHGLLVKYVVASLFRVTWGFALAAILAIPPLAWIPIAILWFGVGDLSAIFLIFVGCFFPLLLTAMSAVHNIPAIYINVGRNFGLSTAQFVSRVLYPAVVPQLIIGARITMGIAWLVVVAAEMIA